MMLSSIIWTHVWYEYLNNMLLVDIHHSNLFCLSTHYLPGILLIADLIKKNKA